MDRTIESLVYKGLGIVVQYAVNKQLLPGLLVDSADYHPEKELFPEGNARGK